MNTYYDLKEISECANEVISLFVKKDYTVEQAKIALRKATNLLERSKVS